jgi:hypothetical protein
MPPSAEVLHTRDMEAASPSAGLAQAWSWVATAAGEEGAAVEAVEVAVVLARSRSANGTVDSVQARRIAVF